MTDRRALYLACCDSALELLAHPALAERWAAPSALEAYTCGALAGHLVRSLLTVDEYLANGTPGLPDEGLDAVEYFHRALGDVHPVDAAVHVSVRERSAALAGDGAADLLARATALAVRLRSDLPAAPADLVVTVFGGMRMRLDDYLDTRFVELLVHLDDLAVSLGAAAPGVPDEAATRTVGVLAELARRRHGTAALLRTLARTERAPDTISAL